MLTEIQHWHDAEGFRLLGDDQKGGVLHQSDNELISYYTEPEAWMTGFNGGVSLDEKSWAYVQSHVYMTVLFQAD